MTIGQDIERIADLEKHMSINFRIFTLSEKMHQKFKILYYSILFLDILHRLMDAGAHWVEPETVKACPADGNPGATYEGHPRFIQIRRFCFSVG